MARLRSLNGHILTLPPRRVSVGESVANEIPIARGNGLAAVHFRLQPWESGYFLEDCGSGLGTLVNGLSVSWAPLNHGDVITAGNLTMTYESGDIAIPEFPLTLAPSSPASASAPPSVEGTTAIERIRGAPEETPPSWLPPEALQPPVPPGAWSLPPDDSPSGKRFCIILLVVLLLLATVVYFLWIRS